MQPPKPFTFGGALSRRRALGGAAAGLALAGLPGGPRAWAEPPDKAAEPELALALPNALSLKALAAVATPGVGALVSPFSLDRVVALSRAGLEAPPPTGDLPDTLVEAAAVWLDTGMELTEAAAKTLAEDWSAEVTDVALATEGAERINAWVAEATDGRLERLIAEPLAAVELVLTHALLFKDSWSRPFDPDRTQPAPFTLRDGADIEVPFMSGDHAAPSWQVAGGTMVALGFRAGGQLLAHLPDPDQDPLHLQTDGTDLAPLPLADAAPVSPVLPKLDLTVERDLTDVAAATGLAPALQEGLASLTPAPLVPGPIAQAVRLKIDEAGAEAAAATAAIATRSLRIEPAPELRFDRPFTLFLTLPGAPTAIIAAAVEDPR